MNWQTELNQSFSWLIMALIYASCGLVISAYLIRQTPFGQKFWHITRPCWQKANQPKAIALALLLLLMVLLEVRISVLNSFFTTVYINPCKTKMPVPFGSLRASMHF